MYVTQESNALSTAFFAFLWIFIFYLSTIILINLTYISHKVHMHYGHYFYITFKNNKILTLMVISNLLC